MMFTLSFLEKELLAGAIYSSSEKQVLIIFLKL